LRHLLRLPQVGELRPAGDELEAVHKEALSAAEVHTKAPQAYVERVTELQCVLAGSGLTGRGTKTLEAVLEQQIALGSLDVLPPEPTLLIEQRGTCGASYRSACLQNWEAAVGTPHRLPILWQHLAEAVETALTAAGVGAFIPPSSQPAMAVRALAMDEELVPGNPEAGR
jgi:hypothetical protein